MSLHTKLTAPALALCAILGLSATASAQNLRVALCGAASASNTSCQWIDVQTRLLATGRFERVDIINVGLATPTLAELLPYDALLSWTNTTPLNTTAWGDAMADYVDAGGGVVVAVFANSTTTTNRNIGGRWQTGYEVVLDQGGNASGAGGTLGTVHVPSHPTMSGVSSFTGGTIGSRPVSTALEVGARLIAEWNDGKVLIAEGANPRRIDLGFYPPNASCTQSGWATGGDLIMANALEHVGRGARFAPFGTSCAGTLGAPTLAQSGNIPPALGAVFGLTVDNMPNGVAFLSFGTSDALFGGLPLPLDLSILGMNGCSLYTEIVSTLQLIGLPSASIALPIPLDPTLLGGVIYSQALVGDPAANQIGLTSTNGGRIRFGV